MRPVEIQGIGSELAIRWEDGSESFIPLERLRRACPCAGCRGETDVLGQVHRGPAAAYRPESFQLRNFVQVGNYGIQPAWGDGHATGIFSFTHLRQLAGQ